MFCDLWLQVHIPVEELLLQKHGPFVLCEDCVMMLLLQHFNTSRFSPQLVLSSGLVSMIGSSFYSDK